jgi:hypothetical protein
MNEELEKYLNRPELSNLRQYQKELLRRYVRRGMATEYPVGRLLANGLIQLNSRFNGKLIHQNFINWLYYY